MFDDSNDGGIQFFEQYQSQFEQENAMAKISDMIESKYLKQGDVDEEALVTITKVGRGNIAKEGDAPDHKWMVRFKEFPKPMIINPTNIKRLAKACKSEDTDDWIGKVVMVYVDHDVEFAGNIVGGLRIREHRVAPAERKGGDDGTGPGLKDLESDIPF